MTFLLPSILAGLIALMIPIVIHLLHRRRSRKIKWGAMQFLSSPVTAVVRRRNLRWYLLMATRIGVIALAVLSLSSPRIASRALPQGILPSSPVSVAIIIDHSVSTQRPSGGQSAFDRSINIADEILRQLRPADSAFIILAEHKPRLLSRFPVSGADQPAIQDLQTTLHAQPQGVTDCSMASAVAFARKTLEANQQGNQVILVLSPEARANWQPQDRLVWQSALATASAAPHDPVTAIVPIPLDSSFDDAAVSDIAIEPAVIGVSRPMRIQCTVTNRGTQPLAARTLRLTIDDVQIDNAVIPALLPKAATPITFELAQGIAQPGSHRIRLSLDSPDSFSADDTAIASVEIQNPVSVLVVNGNFSTAGEDRSSQFLLAAIHPNDQSLLVPTQVSLAEISSIHLNHFAIVILNNCPALPRSFRDDLVDYVRSGHGLWCILGPRTQPDFLETNFATTGLFPAKLKSIQNAPAPAGNVAIIKDKLHPTIAAIARSSANPLAGSNVQSWWSLETPASSVQTIIAAPSGDPLALECPFGSTGGAVLLWTTSADTAWNTWPLMPNFVPMVHEAILHLAAGQLAVHASSLSPGQPIQWSAASDTPIDSLRITRPDGATSKQSVTVNDGRYLATVPDTFDPGFYMLRPSSAAIPPRTYAVNIDSSQLGDSPMDINDLNSLIQARALSAAHPSIGPDQLSELLRPRTDHLNLTTPLLIAILAALVTESALAFSIMRASPGTVSRSESTLSAVGAKPGTPGGVAA